MAARVLTINGGSSSIKYAIFEAGDPPRRMLKGAVERIGTPAAVLSMQAAGRPAVEPESIAATGPAQAAESLIDRLHENRDLEKVAAVGHRIVHGGARFVESQRVTPAMLAELRGLSAIDPDHLPVEIALIETLQRRLPALTQVACFDTAFHHDLPREAQLLPIPRRFTDAGVRRYGFHGLSYRYLMAELTRKAGPVAAAGRIVLAHLGAGASMAAVREGKCLDTTMSFTPTAGLVMATRCGDLDPGLLIYLLRSEGMNADQLDDLVNRRSGLLGISDTSSDMRDLVTRAAGDPRAAEAIAVFCYQAKKWIGALATALGGIDTLVFAGGIGEHAAEVRQQIASGLEFLGIAIDAERNAAHAGVISTEGAGCTVRVIATDEESVIAGDTQAIIASAGATS
jgi:acetate kinase